MFGTWHNVEALNVMLWAAKSEIPEIRFWAAYSLGQIGDPSARPILKKMIAEDTAEVEGWWSVQREARHALTFVRKK
ncbi:MAG: HEAT repeat domain-containing protein [Chthonomonadales bacterium]